MSTYSELLNYKPTAHILEGFGEYIKEIHKTNKMMVDSMNSFSKIVPMSTPARISWILSCGTEECDIVALVVPVKKGSSLQVPNDLSKSITKRYELLTGFCCTKDLNELLLRQKHYNDNEYNKLDAFHKGILGLLDASHIASYSEGRTEDDVSKYLQKGYTVKLSTMEETMKHFESASASTVMLDANEASVILKECGRLRSVSQDS